VAFAAILLEATAMSYFRLYVFDQTSCAIQSFDLIARESSIAVDRARHEMDAMPDAKGYELWQSIPCGQGGRKRKWSLARRQTAPKLQAAPRSIDQAAAHRDTP
jgi:hypothetical protein